MTPSLDDLSPAQRDIVLSVLSGQGEGLGALALARPQEARQVLAYLTATTGADFADAYAQVDRADMILAGRTKPRRVDVTARALRTFGAFCARDFSAMSEVTATWPLPEAKVLLKLFEKYHRAGDPSLEELRAHLQGRWDGAE